MPRQINKTLGILDFEWDPGKEIKNIEKHEINFTEAMYTFSDTHSLTLFDEGHSKNEDRWITIGRIHSSKLLVVVYTNRGTQDKEIIRIISARKAKKKEEKEYFEGRSR